MEFKRKVIIWEENTEPPKNYIWVKPNGKTYEYDYSTEEWIESENVKTVEKEESVIPDESYKYLVKGGKLPKYFWVYLNNDETRKEIFGSDIIIAGNYASPTSQRLAIDFSKLADMGILARFMQEAYLGYAGFGIIYEKEDNFELTENDIRHVQVSSNSASFKITLEYFSDQFVFDPTKLHEIEIDGVSYYEYEA